MGVKVSAKTLGLKKKFCFYCVLFLFVVKIVKKSQQVLMFVYLFSSFRLFFSIFLLVL